MLAIAETTTGDSVLARARVNDEEDDFTDCTILENFIRELDAECIRE